MNTKIQGGFQIYISVPLMLFNLMFYMNIEVTNIFIPMLLNIIKSIDFEVNVGFWFKDTHMEKGILK